MVLATTVADHTCQRLTLEGRIGRRQVMAHSTAGKRPIELESKGVSSQFTKSIRSRLGTATGPADAVRLGTQWRCRNHPRDGGLLARSQEVTVPPHS